MINFILNVATVITALILSLVMMGTAEAIYTVIERALRRNDG